ncbi:hypothetical protein [Nocardioides sp. Soil805]|uniref:hypothetical protein n=1 Tax=Nocardioides sp. Soil805 TaxID=1736416 RepID=UPI000702D992|nr:hypothetical protein [Nocardioides sp. Soil805]KRF36280.1 hypothetical protein ASG94_02080 [Nocardioides sp. Soil805]
MTRPHGDDGAPDPEVGSLAEETAKLLGALSGWAREHGADAAHGTSGLADHLVDQVAGAAHQVGEHLDTGAPECTVCPICRTVHAVRQLSPEVKAHLAVAASSLVQAAAGVLATVAPDPGSGPDAEPDAHPRRSSGRRTDPVQKIVLDEDWPEEDS